MNVNKLILCVDSMILSIDILGINFLKFLLQGQMI